MTTILKALVLFWPFIKSLIFKDRTVLEVIHANKQFTYMFIVLVFVTTVLYLTTHELAATNDRLEAVLRKQDSLELECTCAPPAETDLLLNPEVCTANRVYDKSYLTERLLQ